MRRSISAADAEATSAATPPIVTITLRKIAAA